MNTSFITSVIVGISVYFWVKILEGIVIQSTIAQFGVFLISLIVIALGLAIYLYPKLPAYPVDHLMIVIKDKFNLKIMHAKLLIDISCFLIALIFHGPIGIGTLLFALLLGPGISIWQSILDKHLASFIN